jgi:hypothetical protein
MKRAWYLQVPNEFLDSDERLVDFDATAGEADAFVLLKLMSKMSVYAGYVLPDCKRGTVAKGLGIPVKRLDAIIKQAIASQIFVQVEGGVFSPDVKRWRATFDAKSEAASAREAARKGAQPEQKPSTEEPRRDHGVTTQSTTDDPQPVPESDQKPSIRAYVSRSGSKDLKEIVAACSWPPDGKEFLDRWINHRETIDKPLGFSEVDALIKDWSYDVPGFIRAVKHHQQNGNKNIYPVAEDDVALPRAVNIDKDFELVLSTVAKFGRMQAAQGIASLPEKLKSVVKTLGWSNLCSAKAGDKALRARFAAALGEGAA